MCSYSSLSGIRHSGSPARAPAASRRPARASSLANSPAGVLPEGHLDAAGEGGDVDQDVRVELVDGVGEPVGQDQPALGVGVGDLGRAAAVLGDHVAGPHRGAADGVLGHRQQPGDPDRAADRGERGHHGGDHGGAGHVALHGHHRLARLDREPAAVEGDALADQHDVRAFRRPAPTWVACSRAARTAAGRPRPGRRRRRRRSPRSASCFSSRTVASSPAASAAATACSASQAGVLMLDGTLRQQPRLPAGAAPRRRPGCERRSVVVGRRVQRERDPCRPVGARGPSRRSEKPNEPSVAPSTKAAIAVVVAHGGDRRGDLRRRSVVRRARLAPARRRSVGVPSPTPTSSTRSALARTGRARRGGTGGRPGAR